ncbi:S100P-binding protein isoform X2 [Bombina bombina]|uniref:S100P-binding protein isoform X2 n=1 Tax=Bombina bombina TaxID=8345 RepID=UPI00235A55B6|nr:S100P-binding protein isoform X2 [Bombina bombina]
MKNFSDHPCQPSLISNKNRKVNWGVSHLDTMEDIRISIVNDRVPGTKRARDQTEAQSPCPKRCRNVFICSTPCSASYSQAEGNLKNCLLLSPTSAELTDELDDSLLEPSGEEGDSPLHLTQEQIDELLEDDGCYAAESSTLDSTAEVQVICPRPHLNTAPESSDIAKQEKEPTTAVSESSDKKGGGSSVPLTCKTSSQKSKKQLPPQMVAPVWCNKTSPTFAQGKKLGTVTPLPRPVSRVSFSSYDLVEKKNQYINRVMMHLDGPNTSEDPHYQLASLLNQISRENPNWQHPADFTRRNHPRYRRKEFGRCSLHEWVTMNGGPNQRFKGLPHTFQRSPVPEESPFEPL